MTPAAAMPVAIEVLGFDIGPIPIVLGVLTGLTYGLLAVGLVLVYRASKFINFAQTAVGVFGAAVLGALVTRAGVPYWIAFPVGIIAGAGMAGLIEAGLIRRISSYPRVIGMVVTLGMATFLLAISTVINADAVTGIKYPKPPGLPTFEVGGLPISSAYVAMVMLTPLVLVALVWFLKRSRYGLATRAAADNADAASLAGVSAARMVTLSWVVAGAISAFTAILVWPTQGTQGTDGLGPTLLLKGLAGAVIARFQSLPLALGSSVIIGVIEQILLTGSVTGGLVELALGVIIILALLLQPRLGRRQESEGDWGRLFPAPLPSVYQRVLLVRIMDRTVIAMLLVGLAALYLVINNAVASGLVYVVGFTLVGLSVAIVTGLAGQLTLGQFAFAGIGAAVSVQVGNATGNYWLGLVAGVAAAAVAAALVGVPALRLRGLALAVSTLAFALITSAWLLKQPFFLGEGVSPSRPVIFGFSFAGAKEYYLLAVLFLALGIVVAGNVRSSGFGRLLRALRDNEEAARALTVGASRRKLQVYAVAGAIAGLGGIVLGQAQVTLTTLTFSPQASIDVVATAVVGGLGVLLGPLYGSAYAVGIPTLLKFDALLISVLTLSWLVILVIVPGGLGSGVAAVRRRVADTLARASGIDPVQARLDDAGGGAADRSVSVGDLAALPRVTGATIRPRTGAVVLETRGLTKSFGGVQAVRGVDLQVQEGEILGIIGPNGAGKTTVFEMVAGFTKPDAGAVLFQGKDITHRSPEQRAEQGLVRSFQAARLFPTLTVLDTVTVAQESLDPSSAVLASVGLKGADRRKRAHAMELLDVMGLGPLAHRPVGQLSTGTRRMVELTSLLALDPAVLLLDEPAGGIAQSEGDVLVELFGTVRRELGTTLVVIEHDLPLLFRLADRLVAMELGAVIAVGTPDEVRNHPDVVRSYLGGEVAAVERSGWSGAPASAPAAPAAPAMPPTAAPTAAPTAVAVPPPPVAPSAPAPTMPPPAMSAPAPTEAAPVLPPPAVGTAVPMPPPPAFAPSPTANGVNGHGTNGEAPGDADTVVRPPAQPEVVDVRVPTQPDPTA